MGQILVHGLSSSSIPCWNRERRCGTSSPTGVRFLHWLPSLGTEKSERGGGSRSLVLPAANQSGSSFRSWSRARSSTVLCLGLAGSLSTELRRGDLVAPVASVRGDGVSDYWADPKMPAVADVGALSALNESARRLGILMSNGILYSSATWYREPDFIEQWAELGVVGIQNELALYYLLPHLYGKKAAGLYVISDAPIAGEAVWRTGFHRDQAVLDACERAVDILLSAIESFSAT